MRIVFAGTPAPAVPTDSPAPAPSDPLVPADLVPADPVPADPVPVSADPRLVLLGSTGSIGVQTLDVVGRLAAGRPEGVSAPRVAALAKHIGYAIWCFLLEVFTDSDFFEIEFRANRRSCKLCYFRCAESGYYRFYPVV